MLCRAQFSLALTAAVAALVPSARRAGAATPSYAHPVSPNSDDVVTGRIEAVTSKYTITVRDDRGLIDDVHLHQGTIINPTGLTLEPGMRVTIFGYNAGAWFEANEIDTPYRYLPRPAPLYYGPGWWYPGFPYGYGPSFSLVVRGGTVVRRPFPHVVAAPPPRPIPPAIPRPYAGHH